ncbi:MAG: LLM class flavin-dependent oxidoreductase [Sandaracinus sp.]|nr:LLM class flavin-dependent oxidoreductase [Sandaracinus sp.]
MNFSSYLMGAESLLVQCAEILLQRGHTIRGVISDNREIAGWARGRGIPVLEPGKGLAERITEDFDWFFSIANLRIVPDTVLAKAKQGAVNFHDGPLPKYAGLNAPNWALLHDEAQHGVTWHRIEGGVDEGNVLAQRFFEVPALATALELNQRCYEAAIESFPEVLDKLEQGQGKGEPQDLSRRTYFAKNDRPEAMALVDWSKDADAIVRLVRALDYGPKYPNPLAFTKIWVDAGDVVLVRAAEVAQGSGSPGQVLEASPEGAIVACGTGAVKLLALSDEEGRPRCPSTLAGKTLRQADAALRKSLTDKNAEAAAAEDFWAKRLEQLDLVEVSGVSAASGAASPDQVSCDPAGLEGAAWVTGVAAFLGRVGNKTRFHVGYRGARLPEAIGDASDFFAPAVPLDCDVSGTVGSAQALLDKELSRVHERFTFPKDLVARRPQATTARFDVVIAPAATELAPGSAITVTRGTVFFDGVRLSKADAETFARRLGVLLAAAGEDETPVAKLPLLTDVERRRMLHEWNATGTPYRADATMHQLFEEQVDATPDATALVFEGQELTYRELDERANRVAHVLVQHGVKPDAIVGLYCQRSLELVVGALGILKAGGAYLPLDPEYPADRVELMLEDSRAKVVVTHHEAKAKLHTDATVVVIDSDPHVGRAPATRLGEVARPEHLAYVIYTSGSTGRPKGVMVEHRNASNFFTGMDARIPRREDGQQDVWLAVTSLSFDISVLELFWTLARGFKVVVHRDRERVKASGIDPDVAAKPMGFGVFYWGNDDGQGPRKYEVLLEGAKLADRLGFTSVWTPERHFHAFGGPYPNPSVTGAAVAAVTQNLSIRSGSCVAPLHHPIRIAEEWAVIDNLCNGKVGLAFASGWQPDDFVLRPENAPPNNKQAMLDYIEIVRRLWRGETVDFPTGKGDGSMFGVVSQPRPVSDELDVWVTTAGNPETYRDAARAGANVLTHLLGQSIEELAGKVKIYREELKALGKDPNAYKVTLMLHTYLDESRDAAREIAREPMKGYLRSAAGLIKQYAWAFPAFKKPQGASSALDIDLRTLSGDELEAILDFAFVRYFDDSGFFGTVDDAVARVNQLKAIGIDEIACLVDYGIPTPKVLESIRRVGDVVAQTAEPVRISHLPSEDYSVAAQLQRHGVTHLQCTPSMARMLTLDDRARGAMRGLKCFMIGGEALPGALVKELRALTDARVENMYGPTETTIWSSTFTAEPGDGITPIGTPIANTQLYVLDANLEPVPVGVPGELYIGGTGVTRGYLFRDELTKERFLPNPFVKGGRMYRTGDLVRFRADGVIDFLGRVDHQVKIRGYRIELGEIESRLNELPEIREAVVVAREDSPGDKRLVAYLTTYTQVKDDALKKHLGESLPDYMVPSHFVTLDAFPLTPNAKVDRKKLPRPDEVKVARQAEHVAPESDAEQKIADVWKNVLGVSQVGSKDHFFDLGGHSLLAVQAHRELKAAFPGATLAITDIFRFPILSDLARHVEGDDGGEEALGKAAARAAARRELMKRRRGG